MPLSLELIEMENKPKIEKMELETTLIIEVAEGQNEEFSITFDSCSGEYFAWLTRAECVQLAQMLLRVSDIKTEGNEE